MKQGQFEQRYRAEWRDFEKMLGHLEASSNALYRHQKSRYPKLFDRKENGENGEDAADQVSLDGYPKLYRKVCHYHSLAISRNYSSYLVDYLGELVVRGHRQLYRRKPYFIEQFIKFFVVDFPRLVRQEHKLFWLASLFFYAPSLLFTLAVIASPELAYTIVDPVSVQNFEEMYDPDARVVGSARDSGTNWAMFGYYINNNIGVSFRTFASGLLWGIGSIFFLAYNGFLFGAVAGHLTNVGYTETFFTFVIGHGSFELTAIVISGAAGLKLGASLLFPGNKTRLASLTSAAQIAIKLVFGVIAMLVVAAFLEAFWSSNNALLSWHKYLVGTLLWILVAAYLILGGRSRES